MAVTSKRTVTTPLTPKVILLNGPPRCGKDTVGLMIAEQCVHVSLRKFAQPIIDGMQAMFGVSCVDGMDKGEPSNNLFGFTRRQIAISLSEDWVKKKFGYDTFGRILLNTMGRNDIGRTVVVTDSGFSHEASPIIEMFRPNDIHIVHIKRPGKDFKNDSRSYWHSPKVRSHTILNDGSLDELQSQVVHLVNTSWS